MTPDQPYAILRVQPLKSWSAVSAMTRHGRRQGDDMDHVDGSRSSLNRHGTAWNNDPLDLRSCMEAVAQHHDAKRRKNSPVGSHLLLSASPIYFRPTNPSETGVWDDQRLETWLKKNLEWVDRRWPTQVAAWRLDLDETTPHLDIFLVPVAYRRTRGGRNKCEVSHREAFGKSRKSFVELQSAYAEAMKPLGLARGRPRAVTGAVHVNPAVVRLQMKSHAEQQRALKIGTAGILRRDLSSLRLGPDGDLHADFASRVPVGVRVRFLNLIRPAAPTLIRFERHVRLSIMRLANETAESIVGLAQADRRESADLLDEARWLHEELSRRGVFTPAGIANQLEFLVGELVR